MRSIEDISLENVIQNKKYWNCQRPIEQEVMYFLLIDRFHDGKERQTISDKSFKKGFGDSDTLRKRYGGTIKGITENLIYINEMGITSIWISPFLKNSPESYHGYAIENFLKVDENWGTEDDLVQLVEEAHLLNMRVFFDIVLNHTADNWSYIKKNPIYESGIHYTISKWRDEYSPIPIELRNFNRYSRKGRIQNWEDMPETWDGDIFELKDLILDDSDVGQKNLQLMTKIYSYWIARTDCDGFRIDTAKHIRPLVLNKFIKEIKSFAEKINKNDFFVFNEIVAENDIIDLYEAGDGYLDFPFYFNFTRMLTGEKNNDQPVISVIAETALPIRFLDNHDQIGQIPKHRVGYGLNEKALLNIIKAFMLMPGIPCIYYGTEQGLQGIGYDDGSIRESMFDKESLLDLMDNRSVFYSVINQFTALRKEWQMEKGEVSGCRVISRNQNATGIVALLHEKNLFIRIIVYNLNGNAQKVRIKLNNKLTRNSNLIVYLYIQEEMQRSEFKIENNEFDMYVDSFAFYVLEIREINS